MFIVVLKSDDAPVSDCNIHEIRSFQSYFDAVNYCRGFHLYCDDYGFGRSASILEFNYTNILAFADFISCLQEPVL